MSGNVYPCQHCSVQNWVFDINEQGLCPECASHIVTCTDCNKRQEASKEEMGDGVIVCFDCYSKNVGE